MVRDASMSVGRVPTAWTVSQIVYVRMVLSATTFLERVPVRMGTMDPCEYDWPCSHFAINIIQCDSC